MLINRNDLAKYIIELVFVMVGVYIGILASNWNENRKTEVFKKAILNNIVIELENNKKILKMSIEYHETLMKTLETIMKGKSLKDFDTKFIDGNGFNQIPNWKGIGIGTMYNSAYETAVFSNAFTNMDPELLNTISQTYKSFEIYNNIRNRILARIYNLNSDTKYMDVILTLQIIKGDVTNFEKTTLNQCNDSINSINNF